MRLDNEKQRTMLLQIINQVQFPGTLAEMVVDLKRAVSLASIEDQVKADTPA